jgi:hypothetical protein
MELKEGFGSTPLLKAPDYQGHPPAGTRSYGRTTVELQQGLCPWLKGPDYQGHAPSGTQCYDRATVELQQGLYRYPWLKDPDYQGHVPSCTQRKAMAGLWWSYNNKVCIHGERCQRDAHILHPYGNIHTYRRSSYTRLTRCNLQNDIMDIKVIDNTISF